MNPSKTFLKSMALLCGLAMWPSDGQTQTTIPTFLRVTQGVDTNAPGFLVRTYQIEGFDNQGLLRLVERQMAGDLGPNIANLDDPNYTYNATTGYFELDGVVNFRHDAGDGADNGVFLGPDYPDRPIPGLPGNTYSSDQAGAEAIAFLDFPTANTYEMGVSSDDCFKITSWHNPRDRFALVVGQNDGERSMEESRVLLIRITEPGIYPFRCLWANRTGATGWEWYIFDSAGNRLLIGDSTNGVAKAYRSGPLRPYVVSVVPDVGSRGASPTADVMALLQDESLKVDTASVQLTLNDGAIAGTQSVTKDANGRTTAKFTPAIALELGAEITAQLVYADNGTPSVSVTNRWSFRVSEVVVAPEAAVPEAQVDKSVLGVRVFAHQLAGTDFDNGAALTNIRDQLEDLLGANMADLSGADANGYFYLTNPLAGGTNCVNFNNFYQVGEKGNFTSANGFPDIQFPGTPGTGGLDWNSDNLATEVLTYLEFPAAGGYTMGIKSWDSFAVTVGDKEGRSPKDIFATVLSEYDGDAPDNYLFSFYVPQAGIYPVRLIHNIGIQQGDLEWFSADSSGASFVLVNAPNGLKGYARGPALPAYVRRVSPGPNLAGIQNRTITGVMPDTEIFAEIVDEGTTVQPGNTSLKINGAGTSQATKTGKVTKVTVQPTEKLVPGSSNTVTLVYTDSGGKTFTNQWSFVVVEAFVLDPAMSYPLGSGDPDKRGFAVKVVQLPIAFVSGENGSATKSEAMLAGVFLDGVNAANLEDPTYPIVDGWFQLTTINFGSGVGDITPDDAAPGIPGNTGHTDHYAAEIRTYIEIPEAGLYNMRIYSDDSPRLMQAEAQNYHFGALEIVGPCSVAGKRIAMCATRTSIGSGFGVDVPTEPLVLELAVADPILADADLVNAADLKDKAVLISRGAIAFGLKAARAKDAGAKAVIIFNDGSGDRPDRPPIFMGGTATGVDIPCVFIGHRDGTNLLNLVTTQGPIVVNLQENPAQQALVPNDGYYGTWDFTVYAEKPGLYPFRLVTGNGGGAYGVEWTTQKADGTRILVNSDDPEALKAYRTVKLRPEMTAPTLGSGCLKVGINWRGSGTLLEASEVSGPYAPSADQSMPHLDGGTAKKFFKVEQMK